MIVLKIIGWVLLGILALIILALLVRVRFRIEYSAENTSAVLKWLFLSIRLYPMNKKQKKEEAEEPVPSDEEAPPSETEEAPKEKKGNGNLLKTLYEAEGIDGLISLLQQVLYHTKTFFGSMMHGFVIDELYLDVRCTRSDAAATAIYYGEVCSVLFPLLGALAAKCRMKKYDFNVYPDYIARFSDVSMVTTFHFTPMYLIGITIAYVFRLLFGPILQVIKNISGAKKEKNSRKENTKIKEKSEAK